MIMWFPIAKSLLEHLRTIEVLHNFEFDFNASNRSKNKPMITVEWNSEEGISVHKSYEGHVILYIDITLLTNDVNLIEVYEQQYAIQQVVLDSMHVWQSKLLDEFSIAGKIEIPGVATVGEITRPTYTNRIVLLIEWRKKR